MSVAQLPGSMYPTATRYPGPANAKIFRSHEAPATIGIVRCASGREGTLIARAAGRCGATRVGEAAGATDDSVSSSGEFIRCIFSVQPADVNYVKCPI